MGFTKKKKPTAWVEKNLLRFLIKIQHEMNNKKEGQAKKHKTYKKSLPPFMWDGRSTEFDAEHELIVLK